MCSSMLCCSHDYTHVSALTKKNQICSIANLYKNPSAWQDTYWVDNSSANTLPKIHAICSRSVWPILSLCPRHWLPNANSRQQHQLVPTNPTSDTLDQIDRLLGYATKHPNNKVVYYACDMQLREMYDASFQSLTDERSKIGHIQYLTNNNYPKEHVQNIIHGNS